MIAPEDRAAIAREWLYIIDTLIDDTAAKYDEVQDMGRRDLCFFYAGKRSALDHFRELALGDITPPESPATP
jgi:hypothetical protein